MKFARFEAQGKVAYGIVEGGSVTQITGTPFEKYSPTRASHSLSMVKLLAPCTPSKMFAMALNYKSHLGDQKPPDKPEPFFKTPNSLAGPEDTIILPKNAGRVDEEAELVVVIGKRCKGVSKSEALSYVLGYTCGNDVSARVWQRNDKQWWRAKSSDTFSPIGPFIVTGLDGGNLEIYARVNGKEVQHCHTAELLYDIPTVVSFISQVATLEPGDVIFTGTSGQPAEIRDGEVVEIEITGIGTLRNPVKAEK